MSKSSTTTDEIPSPTPGEILLLEFIGKIAAELRRIEPRPAVA